MPEHLDVELKWPVAGLDVVPAPDAVDGLGPDAMAAGTTAADTAVHRNVEELMRATLSLRTTIDQRLTGLPRDPEWPTRWDLAERALVRLERAALDVSAELTAAGVVPASARQDRGAGGRHRRSTAVTWPPREPSRRRHRPRASRERSPLLVPMFVVVALAAAAVGYKVIDHRGGTPPAAAAGSGVTVAGTKCRAGASVATVRVTSVRQADGDYVVGASGLVSNTSATPLHDVVVHWAVTYGDGRTVDGASPLTRGDTVAGHALGGWVLPFIGPAGPVPAAAARVTGLSSVPARPACR